MIALIAMLCNIYHTLYDTWPMNMCKYLFHHHSVVRNSLYLQCQVEACKRTFVEFK